MLWKNINSIDCLERPARHETADLVVLFHGYGADAANLFDLADFLDPEKKINFLFPNGINSVSLGFGMDGRAWWPLRFAQQTLIPEGIEAIRETMGGFWKEVIKPEQKLIIGGFSQGGMVAIDAILCSQIVPKGLMLFSTCWAGFADWEKIKTAPENLKGIPFFQSHGKQDAILPFAQARQLEEKLRLFGLKGQCSVFDGGHEIPPTTLVQARSFLDRFTKTT